MDEVTQQNSALVEENAATAKALELQAQTMDDHVGYFRINDANEEAGDEAPVSPASRESHRTKPKLRETARAA
jgi:methyl-accepting chemotaxis protein